MRLALLLAAAVGCLPAADFRTPAGPRNAARTEPGPGTILPGGRLLSPYGAQFTTGPGAFGLALSPDGKRAVTANGGPDRFSLTFLEASTDQWTARTVAIGRKSKGEDADDWKSTFLGLAFDGPNLLYASEGDSGQVRAIDPATGRKLHRFDLNGHGFADSYSADLAFDPSRGLLYVLDQANFRLVIFDTRKRAYVASIRTGRLPFALTLSTDGTRAYVTNVGMFQYSPLPGSDVKRPHDTGLAFPPFGFPSKEARDGTRIGDMKVPGLGDPNVPESNSLCVLDVTDAASPKLVKFIRTGLPFGRDSLGGSSPAGVLAIGDEIWVTNSVNDSISVLDGASLAATREIPLRIPGLEKLRGVLPVGLAYHAGRKQVLVAEAGINAVAVVDATSKAVLGHIPAGWFPTRVALDGDTVYVTNAKGHGIGPNATLDGPLPHPFQAERRRGSVSRYTLPASYDDLTRTVLVNNGFVPQPDLAPLPKGLTHAVIIVKENRTYDEVFGDVEESNREPAPKLARYGRKVTPNHHAIAGRFAMSDNFYADSEVSVDGHHWLVGSYPNVWTESTMMAAYAGGKEFKLAPEAPGRLLFPGSNSSVHPEDQLEAGTLWHHLERAHIPFRNFGEGFEFAGVDEGPGLKPTGGRYFVNIPMPEPLFRNTSREYPNYNTNIPDQFRASQFIAEMDRLYRKPGKPLPRLLFIHLPNDHTSDPRPADGYPTRAAYVADNDYALGRIVEYLSQTPEWKHMAIFVTEDDAGGGVDHIDAHRTVMLVASPFAKKNYVAHQNSSFSGMLKTVYRILGLPPLNLYDAVSTDLSECFTDQPDAAPYRVLPIDPAIFDPAQAKDPLDPKPSPKMDDPREVRKQQRQ